MDTNIATDEFADIRPYHDHEVREVLDGLIEDDEFISAIINLRIKRQTKLMKALAYPFVSITSRASKTSSRSLLIGC